MSVSHTYKESPGSKVSLVTFEIDHENRMQFATIDWNGVWQGGVQSPQLFNVYVKDLLKQLEVSKEGEVRNPTASEPCHP